MNPVLSECIHAVKAGSATPQVVFECLAWNVQFFSWVASAAWVRPQSKQVLSQSQSSKNKSSVAGFFDRNLDIFSLWCRNSSLDNVQNFEWLRFSEWEFAEWTLTKSNLEPPDFLTLSVALFHHVLACSLLTHPVVTTPKNWPAQLHHCQHSFRRNILGAHTNDGSLRVA